MHEQKFKVTSHVVQQSREVFYGFTGRKKRDRQYFQITIAKERA